MIGTLIFFRDIDVFVHVADVDVDDDIVLREELGVGALVVVDVEDLAVAAPVAAEVEKDAFVFVASPCQGGGDVGVASGGLGVKAFVWLGDDLGNCLGRWCDGQCKKSECRAGRSVCGYRDHVYKIFEFMETRLVPRRSLWRGGH